MGFDFNNESSLGTNRGHILDLIVLGRRDEWLNTYQKYLVAKSNQDANKTNLFYTLVGILKTIELELRETLKRQMKEEYKEFKKNLDDCENENTLMKVFDKLNRVLDELRITRIDNKKNVDPTNLEATNESKGL